MFTILIMAAQAVLPRGGMPRWVKRWANLLWVLPAFLFYFVFKLLPLISGLYLSLLRWDGIEPEGDAQHRAEQRHQAGE